MSSIQFPPLTPYPIKAVQEAIKTGEHLRRLAKDPLDAFGLYCRYKEEFWANEAFNQLGMDIVSELVEVLPELKLLDRAKMASVMEAAIYFMGGHEYLRIDKNFCLEWVCLENGPDCAGCIDCKGEE